MLLIFVVAVTCLGQLQPRPAYQQLIRTTTSYVTQVLTVTTTQTSTIMRTTVSTAVYPPPPELDVKWKPIRWYWTPDPTKLAFIEIQGNVTNRSNLFLLTVTLKFRVNEGSKSEVCTYTISSLASGQTRDFRFNYTPTQTYAIDWTWVEYVGFDYTLGYVVQSTIVTQTILIPQASQFVTVYTLTTVRSTIYTYTEQAFSIPEGSLVAIMAVVTIATVAIAVVIILRSKSARKVSAPTTTVQPETTIREVPVPQPVQAGKVCPKCQTANESEAKFCVNCGYKL